jgi:ribosomal protein S18 acetylase RimI-like enzyme
MAGVTVRPAGPGDRVALRAALVDMQAIGVLASNDSAIRAYRKHGFDPYEMVLEKRL